MDALFHKMKIPALIVLGIVVAAAAWWGLKGGEPSEPLLTTESAVDESGIGDKDLVETLLTLRAVSLSGTILSDPAFLSLKDFGTEIVAEPVGRPNPFAPLSPGAVAPAPASAPATRGAQLFFSPKKQP